eukprot:gene2442-8766_t
MASEIQELSVSGTDGVTRAFWCVPPQSSEVKDVVFFFEGDQVDEDSQMMLAELVEPRHHLKLLQQRFKESCVIVGANADTRAYFKAASHLSLILKKALQSLAASDRSLILKEVLQSLAASHLSLILKEVLQSLVEPSNVVAACPPFSTPLRIQAVGFSKGCVVLNQLLSELAVQQDNRPANDRSADDGSADDRSANDRSADDGTANNRSTNDTSANERSANESSSADLTTESLPTISLVLEPVAKECGLCELDSMEPLDSGRITVESGSLRRRTVHLD